MKMGLEWDIPFEWSFENLQIFKFLFNVEYSNISYLSVKHLIIIYLIIYFDVSARRVKKKKYFFRYIEVINNFSLLSTING